MSGALLCAPWFVLLLRARARTISYVCAISSVGIARGTHASSVSILMHSSIIDLRPFGCGCRLRRACSGSGRGAHLARACWVEKGEDRQIGHGPPCHLPGRVVCHPWGRGVVGVRSCARSCPFGAGCEEKPKILLFYASYEIIQKALALASAAHCHARAEPDRPLGGVFNTRGRARPPAAGPSHVDGAA